MAATGGEGDDMMKQKPGGSDTPGIGGLKGAWDRFVAPDGAEDGVFSMRLKGYD